MGFGCGPRSTRSSTRRRRAGRILFLELQEDPRRYPQRFPNAGTTARGLEENAKLLSVRGRSRPAATGHGCEPRTRHGHVLFHSHLPRTFQAQGALLARSRKPQWLLVHALEDKLTLRLQDIMQKANSKTVFPEDQEAGLDRVAGALEAKVHSAPSHVMHATPSAQPRVIDLWQLQHIVGRYAAGLLVLLVSLAQSPCKAMGHIQEEEAGDPAHDVADAIDEPGKQLLANLRTKHHCRPPSPLAAPPILRLDGPRANTNIKDVSTASAWQPISCQVCRMSSDLAQKTGLVLAAKASLRMLFSCPSLRPIPLDTGVCRQPPRHHVLSGVAVLCGE